jgi:hypothetical protein
VELNALQAGHLTASSVQGIIDAALERHTHHFGSSGGGGGSSDGAGGGGTQPEVQASQQGYKWDDGTMSPLPQDWKLPTSVSLSFLSTATACLCLDFLFLSLRSSLHLSPLYQPPVATIWECWFIGFEGSPALRMLQPPQVPKKGKEYFV